MNNLSIMIFNIYNIFICNINFPFCANQKLIHLSVSTWLVSTLTRNNCSTSIFKFNKMMIKNFSVIYSFSYFSSTHTLRTYWIFIKKPISYINIMNMLFNNMVTTQPIEIIPVSHLIFHFCLIWFTFSDPYTSSIPSDLTGCNFTYNTSSNLF